MSFDIVRYERGQVWMIRHKNPNNTAYGHEQMKDRPWLILSVGKFNQSSRMVTAVPITTREYLVTPSQVLFENDRGQKNVILCEQIRAFDYSSGAYLFEFLGNISREVLERVDVAISVHLGLHYSPITLKSLYESMESIVKSIGYMQQKSDTPKFSDHDVLDFAEKLRSISVSILSPEVAASVEVVPETDTTDVRIDESTNEEKTIVKKSPRINWTKESCEEFMEDLDNLSDEDIMTKWNIFKKSRLYTVKHYVQRKIAEFESANK